MEQEIIINKLDIMQQNIEQIKEHLEDVMLTKDDLDSIEEAEQDLVEGRTKRLD